MGIKDIQIGNDGKLAIKQFKLETMVDNPSIVVIAARGSGKSIIVKSILDYFKNIPVGVVISPSEKVDPFFSDFFPLSFIYDTFKSELIEKILKEQEGKKIDTRAFIVMDDCLADKDKWAKDPTVYELLYNGRHYDLMYILTMQFPLGIKPELRLNFDYIFLLADTRLSNQKRIFDHYAGVFPNFESFRQVFNQLTDDYGAMVISNRTKSKDFFDIVYWYKAEHNEEKDDTMNICCNQLHKFHNKNFNENWKKKSRKIDYNKYFMNSKKNKSIITVAKEKIEEIKK